MSAQLKQNEQYALEAKLKMRRSDVFEIEKAKARDGLQDEIQETVMNFLDDILKNFAAGDDAENGRILGNTIASYALHIETARLANELRSEFIPSWRSRCEP